MSHWQAGKMSLKCTDRVLHRALVRVFPEWEGHIHIAPEGEKLTAHSYYGQTQKADIIIPSSKNPEFEAAPGIKYSDLMINRDGEGGFDIIVDDLSSSKVLNLEKPLLAELQKMREEAMERFGKIQQVEVVSENNEERVTRFWVERDNVGQMRAQ